MQRTIICGNDSCHPSEEIDEIAHRNPTGKLRIVHIRQISTYFPGTFGNRRSGSSTFFAVIVDATDDATGDKIDDTVGCDDCGCSDCEDDGCTVIS